MNNNYLIYLPAYSVIIDSENPDGEESFSLKMDGKLFIKNKKFDSWVPFIGAYLQLPFTGKKDQEGKKIYEGELFTFNLHIRPRWYDECDYKVMTGEFAYNCDKMLYEIITYPKYPDSSFVSMNYYRSIMTNFKKLNKLSPRSIKKLEDQRLHCPDFRHPDPDCYRPEMSDTYLSQSYIKKFFSLFYKSKKIN